MWGIKPHLRSKRIKTVTSKPHTVQRAQLFSSLKDWFGVADLQQAEVEQSFSLTALSCPTGAACKQQHPALCSDGERPTWLLPLPRQHRERLVETREGESERFSPMAVNLHR